MDEAGAGAPAVVIVDAEATPTRPPPKAGEECGRWKPRD